MQQLRVTHKSYFQAIQTKLLMPSTESLFKSYWVAVQLGFFTKISLFFRLQRTGRLARTISQTTHHYSSCAGTTGAPVVDGAIDHCVTSFKKDNKPASNRTRPNRNPTLVSSTSMDGTTPSQSDVCGTILSPHSGGLWTPGIVNKWKSASPNFWKSDEFDAAVDGNFPNNSIAPPILTQGFSDKLSNSFRRDMYVRCGVHPVVSQVGTHGFSNVNTLNKGAVIWIPINRIISFYGFTRWIAEHHDVGQSVAVGDAVGAK